MSISVTPTEQNKGYGTALVLRLINYLILLKVVNIAAENVIAPGFFESLGFSPTTNEKYWIKEGIEPNANGVPGELFETDIRIVRDDYWPDRANHLIAWYRKSDGAAVAKVRIRIG